MLNAVTYLLGAHEIPLLKTGLETLHGQGARGVRLGPSDPQGSQSLGVLNLVTQEVSTGPFVELDGVEIRRLLAIDELINRGKNPAFLGRAVELGLGANLDCLDKKHEIVLSKPSQGREVSARTS